MVSPNSIGHAIRHVIIFKHVAPQGLVQFHFPTKNEFSSCFHLILQIFIYGELLMLGCNIGTVFVLWDIACSFYIFAGNCKIYFSERWYITDFGENGVQVGGGFNCHWKIRCVLLPFIYWCGLLACYFCKNERIIVLHICLLAWFTCHLLLILSTWIYVPCAVQPLDK